MAEVIPDDLRAREVLLRNPSADSKYRTTVTGVQEAGIGMWPMLIIGAIGVYFLFGNDR